MVNKKKEKRKQNRYMKSVMKYYNVGEED